VRGNAERWCPFGGLETVYAYVTEGNALCSVGVANLFIAASLLLSVLLLRRAFCSHACPIGTISEWVRAAAQRRGIAPLEVPRRLDAALSLAKYGVLALVLAVTWQAGELLFRSACPAYALLGRHGADITFWAYVVSGGILLGSLVLALPFCPWLCPLAAVMNPLARFAPARVERDEGTCVTCGRCAAACPMGIPVHEVPRVDHARCTLCLACVSSCPTRGERALTLRMPGRPRRPLTATSLAGALVALLSVGVAAAALFPLPSFRWGRGAVPPDAAVLELRVADLTCRGRANLFAWYLDRDDDLAVAGPLRLEVWPSPETGEALVTYDPTLTTPEAIRAALLEPYHDAESGLFRMSPFRLEGHDPLALPAPR
jgi:ferredoxin